MIALNCATGTLAPYVPSSERPWDRRRAAHIYKRLGFGANAATIDAALQQDPTTLVESIITNAIAKPLPNAPVWANWAIGDYNQDTIQEDVVQQTFDWTVAWLEEMMSENPLREKLALFWHNHFVTQLDAYQCPSYLYNYHRILQQYALGDFKTFTEEIGKCPAMLIYLNGVQSTRLEPNENYARELYELFTLGENNNYTQQDITETARALTGYNGFTEACAPIGFLQISHDPGSKTIFGQTGNWGYEDVHQLIFTERRDEVANFICTKVYKAFVSPNVDETIVAGLAATFKANDFNLAPVFRQLFKSEHFFDDAVLGVSVKSPIEAMLHMLKEIDFPYQGIMNPDYNVNQILLGVYFQSAQIGQQLWNPTDVAGWDGDQAWINSNTLTGRWETSDFVTFSMFQNYRFMLIDLAKALSNNSADAEFVTQVIVEHFIPQGLQTPDDYDRATMVFKSDFVPGNYFEDGTWSLDYDEEVVAAQIALLIRHITRLPEFQLA